MFPPKPGRTDRQPYIRRDRLTDGQTYGRTYISIYRVASLLKRIIARFFSSSTQNIITAKHIGNLFQGYLAIKIITFLPENLLNMNVFRRAVQISRKADTNQRPYLQFNTQ